MSKTPAKHFVLTLGRSGSNYLVNIINQHPNLLNYGEVLGDWTLIQRLLPRSLKKVYGERLAVDFCLNSAWALRAAQIIRKFESYRSGRNIVLKKRSNLLSVGIKDFSLNLQRKGLERYLEDNQEIKVIGLCRENVVARALSYWLLDATGVVADKSHGKKILTKAVVLSPEKILPLCELIEQENQQLKEMLNRINPARVFHICYEDFFYSTVSRQMICASLYDFLEVDPIYSVDEHKKITKKISDRISNWEEVGSALQKTRFEGYLKDL